MRFIPTDSIQPNPHQPRGDFDPVAIDSLCASISKHGILEPLLLRSRDNGKYEIIAGERRFRAAMKLGMSEIPAIIRNSTDSEMLELAMIENLHREDISPIDKARGFRKLMEEFRYTQNQIAQIMGISRVAVANTVRLLDLPEQIQDALHRKEITEGHARAILSIKDPREQELALSRITHSHLSVRQAEELSRVLEKNTKNNQKNDWYTLADRRDLTIIEELQEKLGTKVHVVKSGVSGKIEIEFYSNEDFKRIIEAL